MSWTIGPQRSPAVGWPQPRKPPDIPVEIKIYPAAHHSFDSRAPIRYVAERININAPTGRGATTGGNAEAWEDAIGRVERFLSEHMAKQG